MSIVAGPAWAALTLLVIAGAPKVLRPYDTMRALRLAGLRVPHIVVRGFGLLETVIAVVAMLTGNPVLLWAAALSYAGFAVFVLWALRRDTPLSSCGCFGKADTPPTALHLVLVAAFAVVLVVAALQPGAAVAIPAQLAAGPLTALVALGFAAIICWLSYLAMTVLPTTYRVPQTGTTATATVTVTGGRA